ncbi:MAG: hypothetical protein KJO69_08680 [Gammaproteobacteria bacterium]|nr:hypothetical protein [Gammaproteobacteria bacterium]
MFNFFRKIRIIKIDEGRFGKYALYASGEILLVVIGILIALQINNWNESRIAEIQEFSYLNRLLEENRQDIQTFKENVSALEKGIDTITEFANALNNQVDNTELLQRANDYFAYGSIYPIFTSSTSTFDDLSSTGNLSLIKNEKLRAVVVKHYAKHDKAKERIRIGTDWALPVDAPFTYEHSIMRYEPGSNFLFGKQDTEKLAEQLRQNKAVYINNTAVHFWINTDAIAQLKTLIIDTDAVIESIMEELTQNEQ